MLAEWAPTSPDYWINFTDCSRAAAINVRDPRLYDAILACFSQDSVDHRYLTAAATSLLKIHEQTSPLFDSDALGFALETWSGSGTEPSWLSNPLMHAYLRRTIVCDTDLESAITRIRSWLLAFAANLSESSPISGGMQPFSEALALQCFFNEHVFHVGPGERAAVKDLRNLAERGVPATGVEQFRLTVVASYVPLHRLTNVPDLQSLAASDAEPLGELVRRQLTEPLIENQLRSKITVLGTIDDDISRAVQNQYEESPYPRWETLNRLSPQPLHATLKRLFTYIAAADNPDNPDILVAGCGTGRQALACAQANTGATVLAVDLIRSSLFYGLRMASHAEPSNIEFVQADILELAALGRQFDLIECVGVLHHLADPIKGWRVLRDLLKKAGFMKIGLYSETARQTHVAAQRFVGEHDYAATPEGIRSARHDIVCLPPDHPARGITERANFYTLSECRDLIFHVQEHRFSLPQIATALGELALKFVGFEFLDSVQIQRYRARYPDNSKAVSLDNWHRFELENPATFVGMYQFWVRAGS